MRHGIKPYTRRGHTHSPHNLPTHSLNSLAHTASGTPTHSPALAHTASGAPTHSPSLAHTASGTHLPLLTLPQALLNLGPAVYPDAAGRGLFPQGIHAGTEGGLRCQHAGDLALVFGRTLAHQRGVVDEPIFGRVMLRLESSVNRVNGTNFLLKL